MLLLPRLSLRRSSAASTISSTATSLLPLLLSSAALFSRPASSFVLPVVGPSFVLATSTSTATTTTAAAATRMASSTADNAASSDAASVTDDPYLWLEDVESDKSLDFARAANELCLSKLGNPETSSDDDATHTTTYQRILEVLESDDRIPHVTSHGTDPDTGDKVLFNFWKDATNKKGIWRKTTLESYKSEEPAWTTVLDVDALAEKDGVSWVWKGSRALPRSRDPAADGKVVTRSLLSLSRGGSDAVHVKEFDLPTGEFVTDRPFNLPEAKSRVSYKSRDVLFVATDFGPDSLTDSGYPRTVREWVRGTPVEDAPVVFEGDKKDVSVFAYITDERLWNGGIYEVRGRSLDFYTSKYFVRRVQYEHLLAPDDPARKEVRVQDPPDFVEVDVQDDASIDFLGNLLLISLRSDWEPVEGSGRVYKKGSIVYTPTDDFLQHGSGSAEYTVLFEPTERTAYEYYTITKNYFVLYTMDNVKARLDFYKIGQDGLTLTPIDADKNSEPQIHDYSVRPVDPYEGSDEFWFTSNGFETPSTLYLADAARVESESNTNAEAFITEKIKSLPDQYDSSNVAVEQRTATSKDGTQIPYFIVMDQHTKMDGKNPTLLYGYGGFEVSLGPHYIATQGLAWLERGGVYVEANIRGGGEFGPAWHQAGLKANRNKCYEDFIAVAEHLIETGVCRPKSLAIRGGSNGGLLMGNMYTMRPDLFGAIHCAVPLLDMKRYHTLLAGASWMAEYGDPDTDDWEFLQKYSPYHNIDASADYPPILVTTSTRDDRVHPGHARKFVKKLWDAAEASNNNKDWVYYYENIEGGHGGAADAKQQAFMTALAYDFMLATLKKNIAEMS